MGASVGYKNQKQEQDGMCKIQTRRRKRRGAFKDEVPEGMRRARQVSKAICRRHIAGLEGPSCRERLFRVVSSFN